MGAHFEPHLGTAPIDQILARRNVLITCGTGGVGKTTLSAAIALRAALLGKRAVVITIDPAKRLISSLGLHESDTALGDRPTDLTPLLQAAVARAGYDVSVPGTLDAIVPDTRETFEAFITELAPSQAVADRVMKNPIFQIFAKEFSGSNEYMALEKLYGLVQKGKYDCIILDTPPSRNTLAFLDAPKLLVQFFEERLIKWLVLPTNRIVSAGMRKALGILEKLTGAGFMTHLFDFASALFEVRARFTANLKQITQLLESGNVGFLMVTVPAPDLGPEVRHFIETVEAHRFHFDGVAVNRTLSYLKDATASTSEIYNPAFAVLSALQERELRSLDSIASKAGGKEIPVCARIPEFARDVHSVEDLLHVAMAMGNGSGA